MLRKFDWEAVVSSARHLARTGGRGRMKPRVLPRAVPVVSAPAWIRSVAWARRWGGVRGAGVVALRELWGW